MKGYRLLSGVISLLLALSIIVAVGAVTAFAAPQDAQVEQQEAIVEEQLPENVQEQQPQEQPQEQQQEQPQEQQEEQPEEQQDQPQEQQQNEWYDYIYSYEDATSAYEEPEYLGELPAVTPQQVVEATAVAMPAVAVSDASLFSGIVMWLCVALGIAVVVGVLVSKRTRRRGA